MQTAKFVFQSVITWVNLLQSQRVLVEANPMLSRNVDGKPVEEGDYILNAPLEPGVDLKKAEAQEDVAIPVDASVDVQNDPPVQQSAEDGVKDDSKEDVDAS
eukprot:1257219-Amphidinium_carterae.2